MMQKVYFQVKVHDAPAHLFDVTMNLSKVEKGQLFRLPEWIPGSYMIRDFARHIVSIQALSVDKLLNLEKIDNCTWRLNENAEHLTLNYQVYAWDLSVRSAHLDQVHAFFNGTSLFLEPVDYPVTEYHLDIPKPEQSFAKNWVLATSMSRVSGKQDFSFGKFVAKDYDDLIDHPVEMGELEIESFEVAGKKHSVAVTGDHFGDLKRLVADLKSVCDYQVRLFGELPEAVTHYVFLLHVLPNGYGGLEHRSSTALQCSENELIKLNDPINDDYLNLLTLCSHEYFHTWNVKQIKPDVFLPYDLNTETFTKQLWIFEGFTSYFEDRTLYDCGVISETHYLKLLSQVITRVYRGSGRKLQSVAESSFDAWTRFYKQGENAPNAIVSYYAKGKLIGLCLDILIRDRTNNQQSLHEVIQQMWTEYGKPQKGMREGDLEKLIEEKIGVNLIDEIRQFVYTTEELPVESLLAKSGVTLKWNNPVSLKELTTEVSADVSLGATVKSNSAGAELVVVYHNSNAHNLGLSNGDVVIAINNRQVDVGTIEKSFARFNVGDLAKVHYFRRGRLYESSSEVIRSEKSTCQLTRSEHPPKIKWLN
ncbi:MAG: M61 family metallopeptidase [Gammaproteobacteria bacterium]|nr:M61 family metallopeptidase [Gammaproteobacteria bacterium]